MAKKEKSQDALTRFGGEENIQLGDKVYNMGEVIMTPGFSMTPWGLDDYERALGLTKDDAYLLRKMVRHAWGYGKPVYPSMNAIARRCRVSDRTLRESRTHLQELGLTRLVSNGNPDAPWDQRDFFDVSGTFKGVMVCTMADARSKWSKANGGPIPVEVARAAAFHKWPNTAPELVTPLKLDFEWLYGLRNDEDDEEGDEGAFYWDLSDLIKAREQAE